MCAIAQTPGDFGAYLLWHGVEARRTQIVSIRHREQVMAATKTDDFAWVSIPRHQPHDRQQVYARTKGGLPKKVTFYARPTPRWEGSSIAYDFQYFTEWAARSSEEVSVAARQPTQSRARAC